ncbi:MAG: polyprenyl diphosphate synthase [Anaplasmataceae bacterium]|nr:polyprenyl diphosphate synthase [Anaplasmataceae bacterium]
MLKHIAIIMDGNRKWAKFNNTNNIVAYKNGVDVAKSIINVALIYSIKYLTLFVFSFDNNKRTQYEKAVVRYLLCIFLSSDNMHEMLENNIKVSFLGEIDLLDNYLQKKIKYLENLTRGCSGLHLNLAYNYSAMEEIISAIRNIIKKNISAEDIREDLIYQMLYTSGMPNPDLLIRTNSSRLSNFMLLQLAYSELIFYKELWPDFSVPMFVSAICEYYSRQRKYGQ